MPLNVCVDELADPTGAIETTRFYMDARDFRAYPMDDLHNLCLTWLRRLVAGIGRLIAEVGLLAPAPGLVEALDGSASLARWVGRLESSVPRHKSLLTGVGDALRELQAGMVEGAYGNDYGTGVIALMKAVARVEGVLETSLDLPSEQCLADLKRQLEGLTRKR